MGLDDLTCIPEAPFSPFSPLILSPGSPYERFNTAFKTSLNISRYLLWSSK